MSYEFTRPNKGNVNVGDFLVLGEERGHGKCFLALIDDVSELNVGARYRGEYAVNSITLGYDYIIVLTRDGKFLVGKEVLVRGLEEKIFTLGRIFRKK